MNATPPLLVARNLSVRFGGVLAVDDVSFEVQRGEVFTLIGPNGAGKTTVFNLISRIYTPTAGTIAYEGLALSERAPHEIAALGIARTFQNLALFATMPPCRENLLIGRNHMQSRGAAFSPMRPGFTAGVRESRGKANRASAADAADPGPSRPAAIVANRLVAGELPFGARKRRRTSARAVRSSRSCCCSMSRPSGLNHRGGR